MNFFGKELSEAELNTRADEVLSKLAPRRPKVLSPSDIIKENRQKEFESMVVNALAEESKGAVAGKSESESEEEEKEIPKTAKQLREAEKAAREEAAAKKIEERGAAAAKKIEERGAAAAKKIEEKAAKAAAKEAEKAAAAAKIEEGRKQSKQQSKKMVGDLFESLKVDVDSNFDDLRAIGNGAEAGQTLEDLMDEFGANGVEAGETGEPTLEDLIDEEEGKTGGKKRTMRKKNRRGTRRATRATRKTTRATRKTTRATRKMQRKNRTRTMRKKARKSRK